MDKLDGLFVYATLKTVVGYRVKKRKNSTIRKREDGWSEKSKYLPMRGRMGTKECVSVCVYVAIQLSKCLGPMQEPCQCLSISAKRLLIERYTLV